MIIKIETMIMDKQVIKITESDLHKIVKESVNKVLTELDWRTYANAAKKRDAQIQQLGRDATDKGGNRLTKEVFVLRGTSNMKTELYGRLTYLWGLAPLWASILCR